MMMSVSTKATCRLKTGQDLLFVQSLLVITETKRSLSFLNLDIQQASTSNSLVVFLTHEGASLEIELYSLIHVFDMF